MSYYICVLVLPLCTSTTADQRAREDIAVAALLQLLHALLQILPHVLVPKISLLQLCCSCSCSVADTTTCTSTEDIAVAALSVACSVADTTAMY